MNRLLPLPAGLARACAVGLALLAGCGGSEDSRELDAAIAQGNSVEIRKEFADVVAKSAATTAAPGSVGSNVPVSISTSAPTSVTSAADATPGLVDDLHPFALAALTAVNQARAQARNCGDKTRPAAGPLTWSPRVAYAALLESEWMLNANSFGHVWPTGELVWDRLNLAGYPWRLADENIAAGFRTLAEAMKAWIDSPPHCVALMRADIEQVGIAVVPGRGDSTYLSYWTMALATPRATDR